MKLIIGGACQGKTAYLTDQFGISKEYILDGGKMAEMGLNRRKMAAVNHLHLYIRKCLEKGNTQQEIQTEILSWLEEVPDLILVSDEIGYGIVPMDAFEREYREAAGRICCMLAQKADMVIRVCCGLGNVIKGEK